MKCKYTYDFSDGKETITVSKKWLDVLKSFDRYENRIDHRESYHCWRIDMSKYESIVYGKRDEYFTSDFIDTPAFEYAFNHLTPFCRDIIYRRVINGERLIDIANAYNVTNSTIFHSYEHAKKRFAKFYQEGLWINSSENKSSIELEKIESIPYGLTTDQVATIVKLRKECKSTRKIAEILNIPLNRIKRFVRDNPLLETKCLCCGKVIKQTPHASPKTLCSPACYYKYFRTNGMTEEGNPPNTMRKTLLSDEEKCMINYYRLRFLSIPKIRKLTGISEMRISAHCYANPFPYTECLQCGNKIFYENGESIRKYCSRKCMNDYNNYLKRKVSKEDLEKDATLPSPEQLKQAVHLKRTTQKSYKTIAKILGLEIQDLELMFKFEQEE